MINTDALLENIQATLGFSVQLKIVDDVVIAARNLDEDRDLTAPEWVVVDAAVQAHDPGQLSTLQQQAANIESQIVAAEAAVLPHLAQLRNLDPDDAAYALMGRIFAVNDGASQATVDLIIDRSTAGDYVTSTTWWGNLTTAQRQAEIKTLDMLASVLQLLIVRLT